MSGITEDNSFVTRMIWVALNLKIYIYIIYCNNAQSSYGFRVFTLIDMSAEGLVAKKSLINLSLPISGKASG